MSKTIDIWLTKISCPKNGFGGSVKVSGKILAKTFGKNPDDSNDLVGTKIIFPFPSGPIDVAQGEIKKVTMESIRVVLSTPGHEPAGLLPLFLKLGGDLDNNLGSSYVTIGPDENLPQKDGTGRTQVKPREFNVEFHIENLTVVLSFDVLVAHSE
jgi:hypothetical protein